MVRRSYGQFCGIARALELVGERWALLVVRDLLLRPKRFTDLRKGIPKIPTNILTNRLKELEEAGVIQRRLLPRPDSAVVYELTVYGRELEDILLRLGRWGSKSLPKTSERGQQYVDLSIRAFRATFRADVAADLKADFEIHFGNFVVHTCVDHGTLDTGHGPVDSPDLVIECPGSITPLLIGHVSPEEAIQSGLVRIAGDPGLLDWFVRIFRIPPDE